MWHVAWNQSLPWAIHQVLNQSLALKTPAPSPAPAHPPPAVSCGQLCTPWELGDTPHTPRPLMWRLPRRR